MRTPRRLRDPHPRPPQDPKRAPGDDRGERHAEQIARSAAAIRDSSAGIFSLLAEWSTPLVRVQFRVYLRANLIAGSICVLAPLLLFFVAGQLPVYWPLDRASLVGTFVSFWPLVMFLGAALRAAGSVLDERTRDTAIQLVLTPMPMREIAASKVLPHLPVFLMGLLAAFPLYTMAGSAPFLSGLGAAWSGMPHASCSPMALWPLRMLNVLHWGDWQIMPSVRGCVVGSVMLLGDLAMVWAAAHWGAAAAVRRPSLPWVGLTLAWRLILAAAFFAGCWLFITTAMTLLALPLGIFYAAFGAYFTVPAQMAIFALLLAAWPLRSSVRGALAEFAFFDRLVDEESRPAQRQHVTGWRWWEVNWRR